MTDTLKRGHWKEHDDEDEKRVAKKPRESLQWYDGRDDPSYWAYLLRIDASFASMYQLGNANAADQFNYVAAESLLTAAPVREQALRQRASRSLARLVHEQHFEEEISDLNDEIINNDFYYSRGGMFARINELREAQTVEDMEPDETLSYTHAAIILLTGNIKAEGFEDLFRAMRESRAVPDDATESELEAADDEKGRKLYWIDKIIDKLSQPEILFE